MTRDIPSSAELFNILGRFGLARYRSLEKAGGTASPKWVVDGPEGRFVLRMRPADEPGELAVAFDHAILRLCHGAGLPVPLPRPALDGMTWLCHGEHLYEALSWLTGSAFDPNDSDSVFELGRFLARFHRVLSTVSPPGKNGMLREDHPDLLQPYVSSLRELCDDPARRRGLAAFEEELERSRERLDTFLYDHLPKSIIHGDVHPGNVRFHNSKVSAVYDFDYVSRQSRVRDLSDGLMFFAAKHQSPFNPDEIWSLTQPFELELRRAVLLLRGYETLVPLDGVEWEALPLLIRSRWIQMRLRGSRKVQPSERVDFVLGPFPIVNRWLDERSPEFFHSLREEVRNSFSGNELREPG